jgi:chromosome segregation protein
LVAYLLEDVYITDRMIPFMHHNFQEGLTLFDNVKWDWTEGIFISVNGNLTQRKFGFNGGSVGMFEGNRIGKARQLEKLSQIIAKLSEQAGERKATLQRLDEQFKNLKLQSKKGDIEQTNRRLNQYLQEQAAVKTRLEQTQTFLQNSRLRREDMLARVNDLEQEVNRLNPVLTDTKARFEQIKEQLSKANEQSARNNEALSATSANYNAVNIRFFQKQNQLKSNEQQLGFKIQEQTSIQQRLESLETEMAQVEGEIAKLQNTEVLDDDALKALYEEKTSIEAGLNDAEREYYAMRGKIDGLEKDLRDLQRKRENLDVLIQESQNKITELRLALTSVIERISVEFEIHLDESDLEGYAGSEKTIEQLQDKVRQVKNQLERMGPINPMAMEAFNEMKQRLDFIAEQKKDLLDARKSLEGTISEIETVAKQNFMEAFNQIRENFKKVFRSLFTEEDTCDLVLAQPENPLESPIEITAKPKGKRPLTINQLSGGEKTLTATSLLFAIYLIKPAPFCIFDEVDAPLDDANIDKFNNIIRTFSKDSQFIIVTHNKRTMSSTDVIYGITMPEQGVSKVIPVDLRELA